MQSLDVISPCPPDSEQEFSGVRGQIERLISEIRLEPGDPFENLIRALVAITDLAYAGPEAATKKMDRAFENNLIALREKLDAEFTAGAEQVRQGNLAGGAKILEAAEQLQRIVDYLGQYSRQLTASKQSLEGAADRLTDRMINKLEEKLLPSLGCFEKAVTETGGKVAAEYKEMNQISRRRFRGVRLWSRFTYAWMFAGAVMLWLACSLIIYHRLDTAYSNAYEARIAEMGETYAANNAVLKTLAASKVRFIIEEKRSASDKPIPGQYLIAVSNVVEVYKSKNGYGVIVFQNQK